MFNRIGRGLWWDRAWTLVEGCTKISPGCDNCWAEREAWRKSHQKNEKIRRRYEGLVEKGKWTGRIRMMEGNIFYPMTISRPTVFAIWNDLFHEAVKFTFIDQVFDVIYATYKRHLFLILTKRPHIALKYFQTRQYAHCPVWLGVTAENQEQADKRISVLLQIPAAKRFVSIEPMLGEIDINHFLGRAAYKCAACGLKYGHDRDIGGTGCRGIDWVICGGETGPNARPMHPDWVRSVRDQCQGAGVPFFFKGWGRWIPNENVNSVSNQYVDKDGGLRSTNDLDSFTPPRDWVAVSSGKNHRVIDGRKWLEVPE